MIDRSPLWPLSPPPRLSRSGPERQVELVVDDDEPLDRAPCRSRAGRAPGRRTRSCTTRLAPARRAGAGSGRAGPRRRRARALVRREPAADPLGEQVERPWSRRCAGCPRTPGRGCRARRPETGRQPAHSGGGRPAALPSVWPAGRRLGLLGRLLALDAGLGLGLGQLGLELLGGRRRPGRRRRPASGSVISVAPLGQRDVAGVHVVADLQALDVDLEAVRDAAWPRPRR